MGSLVQMSSPRGKIGIIQSLSSIELLPELSCPITTICGGSQPSITSLRISRSPPSKCANILRSCRRLERDEQDVGKEAGNRAHGLFEISRSPISSLSITLDDQRQTIECIGIETARQAHLVHGLVIGWHWSRHVRNHPCTKQADTLSPTMRGQRLCLGQVLLPWPRKGVR